jgi:hypothetical protein
VAIPTNFQGYTPAAGTTKSFLILGGATTGIWGNDVDGTFTPSKIPLGPNLVIFAGQAYTDAQILAILQEYVANRGGIPKGEAGGPPLQPSKSLAITSTVCT